MMYFSPQYAVKSVLAADVGPYDLSEEKEVLQGSVVRKYYTGAEGSVSAFIYLSKLNRTGSYAECGTGAGKSSCTDGSYSTCPCNATTGDCSTCSHVGYHTLLNIAGIVSLEVLTVPDASRQGRATAQLVVKTEGPPTTTGGSSASQKYLETIALPEISLQKWTMVVIAREGRRFDVYYDGKIVASYTTMYMPVNTTVQSNFAGLVSGSSGFGGTIGLLNVYDYRLTTKDVSGLYSSSVDTRGRPYIPGIKGDMWGFSPRSTPGTVSTSLNDYIPNINICPSGGCFSAPVIRPASPLYDWVSPYA